MVSFKQTVASYLLLGHAWASLPPIVMKGSKLFYENGTQFYIKGIAYQQDSAAAGSRLSSDKFVDPLASESNCKRDVPYLQTLKTNVIRTYAIDPKKDHSACMKLLDDAGIYVISDLGEPSLSINRDEPKWDVELFQRYKDVVDELGKYDNVIGFFAGNEVSNSKNNTGASAYVKAAVRDTKAYIKKNNKRWLGVGYAANDDANIRSSIAHYFNCGHQEDAIDFWGYNIYEWCGDKTIESSGYGKQIDFFSNYSVPVFFAEYGCNIVDGGAAGRKWEETTALYSDEMTGVFSGGIVYMYFQEANDYGLVEIADDGTASTMKDFAPLQTKIAAVQPSAIPMDSYSPTNKPAECPGTTSDWQVKGLVLPPTPNKELCDCMYRSLSCTPSTDLQEDDYKKIFDEVCGAENSACDGIAHDTRDGKYGQWSMCDSKSQLGYALNEYYKKQDQADDACDWQGSAVVVKPGSVDAACKDMVASASASASHSSVAHPVVMEQVIGLGGLAMGLYILVAMAVGGALVL
ncbi:Glucanosyltransferase domain containing protein [Rhypophila sp. PSN 637]